MNGDAVLSRLVPTSSEIITAVRTVLATEPHLRWGYVFGSAARGGPFRDVDVAIMPDSAYPTGLVALGQLVARLETAVGSRVDLVDLAASPLPFLGPLLTERIVVLDRDPRARHAFEAETTSRWLDFKPAYERASRIRELAMHERLRRGR